MQHVDGDTGGDERVVVLATVLLSVHDDHVGMQSHDERQVRILGPADVGQVRPFAEPRARDGRTVPRRQCFGHRWHQADDPHGLLAAVGAAACETTSSLWPLRRILTN